jgi:hypothetical protein
MISRREFPGTSPGAGAAPAAASPGRCLITEEQSQQLKANQRPESRCRRPSWTRHVGEYKHEAAGTMVTVRRDGDRLLVKVQTSTFTEKHFLAQSETRFVSAHGPSSSSSMARER